MQILQIANGYFQSDLFQELFSALKKYGVESKIVVPEKKEENRKDAPSNVMVMPCFSSVDRLLFFSKQRKIVKNIEFNLNVKSFNVIHAHTVFSGGYSAYQLYKKYGVPYIVAVRNTDVNVFFKYMIHLRSVGIEIMRNAEKIVFLSPAYQKQVISKYVSNRYQEEIKEKSVVIPNGISKLFFEQKIQMKAVPNYNTVRLIYVGEISSNKNLELTIKAAEQLRHQGIDASITAVGSVLEEKYRALIQKTSFVTHYERCPQNEVITHLRNADVFVMPSHMETFGLVYAEAMSQGLPVLYTRGQGFDEQFPDGTVGYAVDNHSATDIAEKIKMVMHNYSALSENCIKLVDRFDWARIAEEYAELYASSISLSSDIRV